VWSVSSSQQQTNLAYRCASGSQKQSRPRYASRDSDRRLAQYDSKRYIVLRHAYAYVREEYGLD
jgi:hypothetical protein